MKHPVPWSIRSVEGGLMKHPVPWSIRSVEDGLMKHPVPWSIRSVDDGLTIYLQAFVKLDLPKGMNIVFFSSLL